MLRIEFVKERDISDGYGKLMQLNRFLGRYKRAVPQLFAKIKDSSFLKNMMIVMSGTVFAQIINYAMSPIISRLFTPANFGVLGSFSAVSGIIAAGATLDYSQALMLPREKEEAINLFGFSTICTLMIGLLCALFCTIAPGTANSLMKTKGVWPLILLVIAVVVAGINDSLQAWAVRVKAFKHTSSSQVIRSLSSSGTRVGFGFLKTGAGGLIISKILADISACVKLARVYFSEPSTLRTMINWERMKRLAKEYYDFPLYSASQNIINALSNGLPVLLLTRFYGISVAGSYAFGITIIQVPMGFILTALRQVLFQKASESQHQGKSLASLYIKTTAVLFAMAIVPSIILMIWAPQIFSWVFGSRWQLSGQLARGLVIWLAIVFCNLPAVLFSRIIRVQRFVFFYDIGLLIARTLALVLGGIYLTVLTTVMVFALVGAAMNVLLIIIVGYWVMKKEGTVQITQVRDYLFGK